MHIKIIKPKTNAGGERIEWIGAGAPVIHCHRYAVVVVVLRPFVDVGHT